MGNCSSQSHHNIGLNEEEIAAVKDSWLRAKSENIGKKILGTLLEKRPQFAVIYGIPEDAVTKKAMDSNNQFQLQAYRIQNFLDTAVSSLGFCPMNSVWDMAKRIGQIHFYKGVNFGADNYLIFKRVTIDEILAMTLQPRTEEPKTARNENESARKEVNGNDLFQDIAATYSEYCPLRLGWNKLMNEIVKEMKKGFLEEALGSCQSDENGNKHLTIIGVVHDSH
ncbi:unnamed protein product, partial [Mesorhabditis belari]|uniref:Globin family profile domain-containing protein n=1 Tax=Mesorhabditis belari TaxID=2138241 RepID=A0AAF3FFU4_9BILA